MERKKLVISGILLMILVSFSSCEAIEAIFKAGMWTMLIIIFAIVGLVVYIASRMRRK